MVDWLIWVGPPISAIILVTIITKYRNLYRLYYRIAWASQIKLVENGLLPEMWIEGETVEDVKRRIKNPKDII